MHRRLLAVLAAVATTSSLTCYDCYSTGPDHKECTKERHCKGAACMIFDAGDNKTATAFCLLAMRGQTEEQLEQKSGCWLEPDGKGKHCMCHTDFCNKLVDRTEVLADPLTPLLPDAEFLKQNPLVDYDNPSMDSSLENGAAPPPVNVLFPAAMQPDPRVAGGEDDNDDLVPMEFDEYDKGSKERQNEIIHSDSAKGATVHPPPCILMWLTMAASWARLFVQF